MIPHNNDIRFELTTYCNYNCVICPREQLSRPKTVISEELFTHCIDTILRDTNQYETLTFSGLGEPLMDKHFLKKAEIAQKKGFKLNLVTNGALLTKEKFLRMQDLGMNAVRVSFYGMSAQSYSAVHGFKRTDDSYARFREKIEELCLMPRTTQMIMSFNVVPGINENDLDGWISFWEGKADLIEAWRPHNWVYGRTLRTVENDLRPSCGRPFSGQLQVQCDGTVNMCCFDFNGALTLGDLKTQSLKEIFSSDPFVSLYNCHKTGDYSNSDFVCKRCDQRNMNKQDVAIYNSSFNLEERVEMTSTTYQILKIEE